MVCLLFALFLPVKFPAFSFSFLSFRSLATGSSYRDHNVSGRVQRNRPKRLGLLSTVPAETRPNLFVGGGGARGVDATSERLVGCWPSSVINILDRQTDRRTVVCLSVRPSQIAVLRTPSGQAQTSFPPDRAHSCCHRARLPSPFRTKSYGVKYYTTTKMKIVRKYLKSKKK